MWSEWGFAQASTIPLFNLGYVLLYKGEIAQAKAIFVNISKDDQWGDVRIAGGLDSLAAVKAVQGHATQAIQLFGMADTLRQAGGFGMAPADRLEYERYLARAREQMDEATFNDAWAAGRKLTKEEAIAMALADE